LAKGLAFGENKDVMSEIMASFFGAFIQTPITSGAILIGDKK
jgi:hypothetical protein